MTALELFRLRQNEEVQRDLRELLNEFELALGATLNLSAGLEIICLGAKRLFGADRTSVWIHDRRARELVLKASSDPESLTRDVRINADDPLTPAAASMRHNRSDLMPSADRIWCNTHTLNYFLKT